MIGRTISRYEILSALGRGGMGVVYLARDTQLDCLRALKFLAPAAAANPGDRERLIKEARVLASLEHPHICPVHEIGEHEGQTFIVMSYLEGRTLKDRLREGPLAPAQILAIVRQVSEALAVAHARGIVHRDIKPDNVMLVAPGDGATGRERAVLMDFGLARAVDETQMTRPGTVMGTLAYMSPEQAGGETADHRTDIWALGAMIHEMATGRPPFRGDNPAALIQAITSQDPKPLALPGKTGSDLTRVVHKALARDRDARYASVAELLADLGEELDERTLMLTRPLPVRRRWTRRQWLGVAAAVVVALAAILTGVFWPDGSAGAITALAVMPLADRSETADQAYFSEGVTDELVTSLNKIGALTIVSPSSAAQARQRYPTNREIAEHLHVDALIDGSVQRIGDRARVSVQLIAAEDDRVLWSESYTREVSDILTMESDIARAVATALRAELTPRETELLTREREVVPEAYEAYLLGQHFKSLATAENLETAIAHYERAIQLDPEFAEPHLGLASALGLLRQMESLPPAEIAPRVKAHIRRALEIDPNLAEAYVALAGFALVYDLDLATAGRNFARARELDPGLGMMNYAQYLNYVGRHEDALREARYAVARDPLDPFLRANLAGRYEYAGQHATAVAQLDSLIEDQPEYWLSYWILGEIQIIAGEPARAIDALEKGDAYSESSLVVQPDLAYAYLLAGRRADAVAILDEFERRAETGYVPPFYLAVLDAAFDRPDDAFAALDAAYAEKDFLLFWIEEGYPALRKLAGDPRWDELIKQIGLPHR